MGLSIYTPSNLVPEYIVLDLRIGDTYLLLTKLINYRQVTSAMTSQMFCILEYDTNVHVKAPTKLSYHAPTFVQDIFFKNFMYSRGLKMTNGCGNEV
jgi:hypothetical protein